MKIARGVTGAALTIAAIVALELLAHTSFSIPVPGTVLMLAVVYAALRDGTAAGLFSAALGVVYVFHHNVAGHAGGTADWRAQVIISIALPATALLVGALRYQLNEAVAAERALRGAAAEEHARSLAILESMTDGFVTFSPDWTIKQANQRAATILGVERDQLIGVNGFKMFPHAFGSSIHHQISHAVDTQTRVEFEDYHPPTDRWYHVRVVPTEADFSVYFRDVTGRRKTLEEVQFQSRLLDAIGQAVIATDLEGQIVYWNKAAESLFGWQAAEVVEQAGIAMVHLSYTEVDDARLYGRIRAGVPWAGEAPMRSKSGKGFMAALSDTPIRQEDGALIGMVRVITDLTKRLSIEEQQRFLAQASAALSASLDAEATISAVARLAVPALADCCVVDMVDEDGRIHRLETAHVDQRMEEVVREIGRRYPLERAAEHPIVETIRAGQARLVSRSEPLIRNLPHSSAMVVPLVSHGRVLGSLTLLATESKREYTRDDLNLTEELARRAATSIENARLYEAAIVASRAKSDFLAVMSHELRTPLTTIMGYTDLLLANVPQKLEPNARTYVERTRTAAWHLLGIIEQILIYARIEVGREKLQPQRVSLAETVGDAAAMVEPVASEKGITFRMDPVPGVIIETDPTKLRQVLVNLLSNAVKFTDHGEVVLETKVEGGLVTFVVRDTGIGIAPEHLEHIFDPFWQVDQSATRNVGGTGLGLSVVRRLARLLGGDVTVQSTPGSGAVFTVQLPLNWGGELSAGAGVIAGHIGRASDV